jgi:UDP-glucose 4-epimerase
MISLNDLSSSNKLTFLIIGGCGFVGTELVNSLHKLNKNIQLYILDNLSSTVESHPVKQFFTNNPSVETFKPQNNTNITYIKGSSVDIHKHCEHIQPDIVFHFGEFSRINASWDEIDTVMKSNLLGTSNVLEYCVKKKSKLVYSASSAILGETLPATPYTYTKKCMVELIKCYHEWFNLEYIITYFYNVYGPKQINEGKYATIMGIFERQYNKGEDLTVVLPGTQERTFTHINDIISGIVTSIQQFKNEDIPIASDDTISIISLAKLFLKENRKIIYLSEQKGNRMQSVKKFENKLKQVGWSTKQSLIDYINEFKNHHLNQIF